jgi:hypothetical protein
MGLLVAFWLLPQAGLAKHAVISSVGGTFPIATVPGKDEATPAVAYDEERNRYLVVNQNEGSLNGACITADGDMVASYVVGSGLNPDVVYNVHSDQYLVVWDNLANIEGAYVSGTCCVQVGCNSVPFTISGDRPGFEYKPAVAYNHHTSHKDYLVVWADDGNLSDHLAIYARRVTSVTVSGSSSFAITETTAAWNYEPDVAYNLNRNEYMVVYTSDPSKGLDQNARDVYGRRVYNAGGGGLLAERSIDTSGNSQDEPSVAAYHLNSSTPYVVAFRDHWNDAAGDVRGYLVNGDGFPVSWLNISIAPGIVEGQPNIASSEAMGGYVVAWVEGAGDEDIYARRMSDTGSMEDVMEVTALPDYEVGPAVAGGVPVPFAVWYTWNGGDYDVYGRFLYRQMYLPLVLRNP